MLECLFNAIVFEQIMPGLIMASLRHRREQMEKNLHVELTRLQSDARKRSPRPSDLQ